jgi:DNA-binding response OmpR family regulator
MKYKILAVDDNPINLKLLSRVLVNSSYQILTAENGQAALDIATAEKPDLILLDVVMPEMDGYEVCKRLHENEDTAYIPIIFLSARNESIDKARGLALGAVDYLTKPFDPLEINARVRTHLNSNQTVIKLLRKNQELQKQFTVATQQLIQDEKNLRSLSFFDKISHSGYHVDNKHLELLVMVKSQSNPVSSRLTPISSSDRQLIFLVLNGFEKDYATLGVLSMLQKFVEGYCQARENIVISDEDLSRLVELILEKFSPDIYEIAFTFSLGLIDFETSRIRLYAIYQPLPFLIGPTGDGDTLTGEAIPFDSPYSEIVTAITTTLSRKSILCYYSKGVDKIPGDIYLNLYLKAFRECEFHLQRAVLQIDEALAPDEKDQLTAVIMIK